MDGKLSTMSFYRFVTTQEWELVRSKRRLAPEGHYQPYKPKEVVCVFESNDFVELVRKYGCAIAEMRGMTVGTKLLVLEVVGSIGAKEVDRSQNGDWAESRAVFGSISVENLKVIAEVLVQAAIPGAIALGTPQMVGQDLRPQST
jgi:hypothetical protein